MRVKVTPNPEAFKRLRFMNEALKISEGDMRGPVLIRLGQLHRKQMQRIFASQGTEGRAGRWTELEERYAQRKRRTFGRKKILQLTGETKARFTVRTNPAYVQKYLGRGRWVFGAASNVAAAHFHGSPGLAPNQSASAKRIFFGIAPRLPVRDMISKTAAQVAEFAAEFKAWYVQRVRQVLRHFGPRTA